MGELFESLPEEVRAHMKQLIEPAGLGKMDDAEELLARSWHEKQSAFNGHSAERGMEMVESFTKDNPGAALAVTYSASLVGIGPLMECGRTIAYASLGARRDVPQLSVRQCAALAEDLRRGESAVFEEGPVQKTSPLFAIAAIGSELDPGNENAALVEITETLAHRFAEINDKRFS